jgi:N-acetylglutamate synthase-like GNAT family acetyltransferase
MRVNAGMSVAKVRVPLEISDDKHRLDIGTIHDFLTTSYWAKGRSRELVQRSIDNSVCFGGYLDRTQVAFGRIITDQVMFAFLADMFVLGSYRGRGYGAALLERMLHFIDAAQIPFTTLNTRDAAGFYAKFGFRPIDSSGQRLRRDLPGSTHAT